MNFVRAIGTVAVGLAVAAAGCGGAGDKATAEQTSGAISGLFVIDHAGADPTGNALAPYTEAFQRVQTGCEGTPEELASAIVGVSSQASNGSGTTITNLQALRAVASAVEETRKDCRGLFVGVEARLEGGVG